MLAGCSADQDWRTASREPAGILPDPQTSHEAVLSVLGANAWSWRGWFAIHTWIAAKKTGELIPLCHPLPITKVALELTPDTTLPGVRITATVKTGGQTGVEMEALTAVSTAALTVYDMVKAVQKDMEIGSIRLTYKDGGKSGRFTNP